MLCVGIQRTRACSPQAAMTGRSRCEVLHKRTPKLRTKTVTDQNFPAAGQTRTIGVACTTRPNLLPHPTVLPVTLLDGISGRICRLRSARWVRTSLHDLLERERLEIALPAGASTHNRALRKLTDAFTTMPSPHASLAPPRSRRHKLIPHLSSKETRQSTTPLLSLPWPAGLRTKKKKKWHYNPQGKRPSRRIHQPIASKDGGV